MNLPIQLPANPASATPLEICRVFSQLIPTDFGGGAPIFKQFLLIAIAEREKLRSFLEIGVYRGKCFFPVAYSIANSGGTACGVDPYEAALAKEADVVPELRGELNRFVESLDFDQMYADVCQICSALPCKKHIRLIRQPSQTALRELLELGKRFDLIHIDGNHDTSAVLLDYALSKELLTDGGFIVFDDINWSSIRPVFETACDELVCVFRCEHFGIVRKQPRTGSHLLEAEKDARFYGGIYRQLQHRCYREEHKPNSKPVVVIGILARNHERTIGGCLEALTKQRGAFEQSVFVIDDGSVDKTAAGVRSYLAEALPGHLISNIRPLGDEACIKYLTSQGIGADLFLLLTGDQILPSADWLQEQLGHFLAFPDTAVSIGEVAISPALIRSPSSDLRTTLDSLIETEVPAQRQPIACNGLTLLSLTQDFPDLQYSETSLISALGQYGYIRRHASNSAEAAACAEAPLTTLREVDQRNRALDFLYDEPLTRLRNRIEARTPTEPADFLIVDDLFPHPGSAFRYAEYNALLQGFQNGRVLCTGAGLHWAGKEGLRELLVQYKREFPQFSGQVSLHEPNSSYNCKVLYGIFLGNATSYLQPIAETHRLPFVFTLYPGGMFGLDNPDSDASLRRVLASPYFRKVIVTQKITYDYLLAKEFCPPESIEYIFGAVFPLQKLNLLPAGKRYFGLDKQTLDICFVAHKYSATGEDKGYPVFIELARILNRFSDEVRFHVVGGFDESVIDVRDIRNLHFHGAQPQDWFDSFYSDKDIIVSANKPFVVIPGGFDGFPTGCVTDAALRRVAMFCTDPLDSNQGAFRVGDEIEIIEPDAESIAERIKFYFANPAELKLLAERGYQKSQQLYGYEQQVLPRIRVLREASGVDSLRLQAQVG